MDNNNTPHVVVIGAGSTGAAVAHDLALRGVAVTLVDRAGVAGGTTGHNQAQLHSGARYAVVDPDSARECAVENQVLRTIMPGDLELNDGLFIATRAEHIDYLADFLDGCAACEIPFRQIPVEQAIRLEPLLNTNILAAVQIPDGVFDPYRFCLRFIATARKNGAKLLLFHQVIGVDTKAGRVMLRRLTDGQTLSIQADAVINAAGPWANAVAELAGVPLELEASAGLMVTVKVRLCNMVINLLAPPDDGDILVPQRQTTILGTTSWIVSDPDRIPILPEQVELLLRVAEEMIPSTRAAPVLGMMAAARPLLKTGDGGRKTTRGFRCYDHTQQGAPGFFSIVGGKTTTARGMAEKIADQVCRYLGVSAACRTHVEPLISYRYAFHSFERSRE